MNSIVDFISGWKDLITKVYGEHTLTAALLTIVAVAVFVLLDRKVRKGKRPTNLMIVLVGWAVAVPIVGFIMTIFGKIWAFIEAVAPMVASALGSFYRIYERHPLLIAVLLAIGVVAYVLWRKLRPNLLPSKTLRIIALTAIVFVVAHIASPVADWLTPSGSEAKVDTKTKEIQSSGSPASSPPTPPPAVAPSVPGIQTAAPPASGPAASSPPTDIAPSAPPAAPSPGK